MIFWGDSRHAKYSIDILERENKYSLACLYDPTKEEASYTQSGPNGYVHKAVLQAQFDYCRYFDAAVIRSLSDHLRQLIGFEARVPSSHEEWYQVDEALRFYQRSQG